MATLARLDQDALDFSLDVLIDGLDAQVERQRPGVDMARPTPPSSRFPERRTRSASHP